MRPSLSADICHGREMEADPAQPARARVACEHRSTLRFDADDVRFRFPGHSSWAAQLKGRKALEQWLKRLVSVGIQTYADEVVVKGPPWNMKLCLRGHDNLSTADGKCIYENRVV